MTEQRFLGLVEVDSGMLLVADPSHVLPSADENKPGVDYSATLGATGHAQPIANGAALLLGSFGGDGTFPVFGHFVDGELMRVTIDLFELDETDE